jgi:hypothetical protein
LKLNICNFALKVLIFLDYVLKIYTILNKIKLTASERAPLRSFIVRIAAANIQQEMKGNYASKSAGGGRELFKSTRPRWRPWGVAQKSLVSAREKC